MFSTLKKFSLLFVFAALSLSLSVFAQDANREGGPGMRGVRGTVVSISGSNLTVKDEQGVVYQVSTGANTRVMKDRQPIKIGDVHVGDMVATGGEVDAQAKTVGAVFLAVMSAEQVQQYEKARAEFGKTWTAGTVTAINETKISIKRPDNTVQVISVDENTSFRKHRESITLADIAVGDSVMSRGALKDGAFVATELSVGNPGQMRMLGERGGPGSSGRGPGGRQGGHHQASPDSPAPDPAPASPQNP